MQLPKIDDRTALLIIDVQKGFINEHTAHLPDMIEGLQSQYKLAVATRFFNRPDSAFRKWMNWPRFEKGSTEYELAIKTTPGTSIMDKATYNAITPELLALLSRHKIETVHIAGMDTNMCVFTTAAALFDTNAIKPVVLYDYCGSHSGTSFHEQAFEWIKLAIGETQIWKAAA